MGEGGHPQLAGARPTSITKRYLGEWAVARTIVDAAACDIVACSGSATLRWRDGCVRYDEAVWFDLNGRRIEATRSYLYREIGRWVVATFADGKPFFSTAFGPDGCATATHPCGADLYTGAFRLRASDWETQWDVTGAKALRITTRYTRLAAAGADA